MLLVRDLHKEYGDLKALQGVSFEVNEGDILGFLGPNGAGKSTTMRIITGYLPATSGLVQVDGLDVATQSLEVRRRIGYLPESTPLYTDMRVVEYLSHRAHLKGVKRRNRRAEVAKVMGLTLITPRARQIIGNLSKGFRQRVGIADALLGDPRLLILDEPTIGLDPNQVRQVRELIRSLSQDRTVILSTHILAEVEMICNKVVIINAGATVASDSVDGLVARYDEHAVRVLLSSADRSEELAAALEGLDGVRAVRALTEAELHAGEAAGFRVLPEGSRDLRGALFALCESADWPLLEIHRERTRLEDVFSILTSNQTKTEDAKAESAKAEAAVSKAETEAEAPEVKAPEAEAKAEAKAPEAQTAKAEEGEDS